MVSPARFDPFIYTRKAFNRQTRANNSEGGSKEESLLRVTAGLTITDKSWRCCQFFFLQQWRRSRTPAGGPREPSGVDGHPCSMRPMLYKGKSQYREFIGAHTCVRTPPTGKDELKEPRKSWDPVWTWHSLLWVKFIFVSRAWTVKVGVMFWFFPSPRWPNPISVLHDRRYKHELECWQILGAVWKFCFSDGKI